MGCDSKIADLIVSCEVIRSQLVVLYAISLLNFHFHKLPHTSEALLLIFRKILLFQKLKEKFLYIYRNIQTSKTPPKKIENHPNTLSDSIFSPALEFFSNYCTIETFDDPLYCLILWLLIFTWMKQNQWDIIASFIVQFKQCSFFPFLFTQTDQNKDFHASRIGDEKKLYYWWYIEAIVAYQREMMNDALTSLNQCIKMAPFFLPAHFLQGFYTIFSFHCLSN
jgi:hypothetical protein